MNLYSLLDKSAILANLYAKDKNELINSIINLFKNKVSEDQLNDIREAVFEREKIMSTGVGKNLAIPHGKVATIEQNYAGFATLKEPVDFDSIDGKPVTMVFLLVGPEKKNNTHIKLLSRISRLMNSSTFRESLLECETPDEIYEAFHQEEMRYFGN
jgi:fructose-specific phosphotransferase system IIA component